MQVKEINKQSYLVDLPLLQLLNSIIYLKYHEIDIMLIKLSSVKVDIIF